ncbi:hypothetical protein K458DRAFT_406455 [Lentithecium fluviatile CBS 122367]|uniref:t-SNARE coiled-coil homology domain-containing protein n=1 Tax=Lentithecium fluviatile CBS 122367 TaxID=1168545 RepID=A0A6G1IT76_9PLEO|nr:hypothetical protein K458DRAFT_406455 [Lentithecium fluviatile CBS 122367]
MTLNCIYQRSAIRSASGKVSADASEPPQPWDLNDAGMCKRNLRKRFLLNLLFKRSRTGLGEIDTFPSNYDANGTGKFPAFDIHTKIEAEAMVQKIVTVDDDSDKDEGTAILCGDDEEEDIQAAKNEIREIKRAEVASSQNALRLGHEALGTDRKESEGHNCLYAHQKERDERDALQKKDWEAQLRKRVTKYQFEPDSEEDFMEEIIERNLGELEKVASALKGVVIQLGGEVEEQNQRLDGLRERVDGVDDGIFRNRMTMKRVKRKM